MSTSPGVPADDPGLLRAWSDGDAAAFDRGMPLVYDELHRMPARYRAGERSCPHGHWALSYARVVVMPTGALASSLRS